MAQIFNDTTTWIDRKGIHHFGDGRGGLSMCGSVDRATGAGRARTAEKRGKLCPVCLEKFTALPEQFSGDSDIRIDRAIEIAVRFGGINKAHRKAWVIDQMVRQLAGERYDEIINLVTTARSGNDGSETYEWDVGIAP